MKILLVGGGTAGSVSPLLAVKQYLQKNSKDSEFFFLGTRIGPERELVAKEKIPHFIIPAGKWRRYFSVMNIFDIFVTIFGFFVSLYMIFRLKPDIVLAAGSFVSVPVAYASRILGVKILIHQQDVSPSLSNKIIYPICTRLTVSVPESQKYFFQGFGLLARKGKPKTKIIVTGNPVREAIGQGDKSRARKYFGLSDDLPVLLVLGGSSGSGEINKLITAAREQLTRYFQVIHVTGKKAPVEKVNLVNYHAYQFLTREIADAYKIADIVLSRAGFSTISELAYCKKMSIIIPLPNTQQEINAQYLFEKKAAVVLKQDVVDPVNFVAFLRKLNFEHALQDLIRKNIAQLMPRNATQKLSEELLQILRQ